MQILEHAAPLRILIIEDEPMIAFDLRDLLEDAGFIVVAIAATLKQGLASIADIKFDTAIVDANLGGVSSSPAAFALASRGVPFIILSGYSLSQQQDAFPEALSIQKPCRPELLIKSLRAIQARL